MFQFDKHLCNKLHMNKGLGELREKNSFTNRKICFSIEKFSLSYIFLYKINLILISVSETQKCKQPAIEELIKLMKERPQDVKAQLTGCRCMGQFAYDGTIY